MGIKLGSAAYHAVATVAVAVAVNPAKPTSKWLNVIPMCVFARISRSPRVAILPQPISPSVVCARFCGLFSMLHSCPARLIGAEARWNRS